MRTLTKSMSGEASNLPTPAQEPEYLGVNVTNVMPNFVAPPKPNLWQKLVEVAARCSYVQKGGVNLFHKYNYVTAADVFDKVSNALHDVGLASWTEAAIYETREKPTKSGGIDMMVTVRVTLHVVDPESGQEIATVAYGSGQDAGDKAVMKAQTAALKYAWMMLLNISTGDDPEADEKVDERMSGQKKEKPPARGPAKGDFTAADKELARQREVDGYTLGTTDVESCELCGNPLSGPYQSPKGEYMQCQWAHEERAKTLRALPNITTEKLAAVTKGHTFKRVAAEPGKARGGPSTTVAIPPAAHVHGSVGSDTPRASRMANRALPATGVGLAESPKTVAIPPAKWVDPQATSLEDAASQVPVRHLTAREVRDMEGRAGKPTAQSIADEVAGLEGLTSQERIEELSRRINETLQP